MMIIFWSAVFLISLFILLKSSDFFTDAAEEIGLSLKLSPFLIGVTIVAVGTSIPELVSSLIAARAGYGELVTGTVVGSNIARILLVLGLSAIAARKLHIVHELISVDLPFLLGSAFLMTLMMIDGSFVALEAIICLLLLIAYVAYTVVSESRSDKEITKEMRSEFKELKDNTFLGKKRYTPWFVLLFSALLVYLSARFTVDSVVNLASLFQISPHIIAITAVALGTSLPELSVTLVAARKHKAEIAVGNLLGSNIFNSLAVMGLPALLFGDLPIPFEVFSFALPMMVAATFLYVFITQDKMITHWEGYLLLSFYVFFLLKIFAIV